MMVSEEYKKIYLYISACIIFIIIFFSFPGLLLAKTSIIKLENGSKAVEYLPKKFNIKRRYPIIMVLRGKKDVSKSLLKVWKPIADNLEMILICPIGSDRKKGYTRKPTDDRKNFIHFMNSLDKKYSVDFSKSILTGFSQGGTFALETGLVYPRKFQNIISMFGYLNKDILPTIKYNNKRRSYRNSCFFLITGKEDATLKSVQYINKVLSSKNIRNKLKVYPELIHSYPPALTADMKKIRKWMFHR